MTFSHTGRILRLAAPLILSASTVTIQQLIDAIAIGRHSEEALAAMGPSSMAVVLVQSLLFGTSGYASAFVARAFGAGDVPAERRSAWLGIHFSLWSGLAMLALAWPLGSLFHHLGHAPVLAEGEALYFRILAAGSFFPAITAALTGWLSARNRTLEASTYSIASFLVNAALAPLLVLGLFGLPRMGLAGAAIATLCAQAVCTVLLLRSFRNSDGFRHPSDRRIPWKEMRSFLALAAPQGMRIAVELLAWSAFLVFVGRLGIEELAASSIAFRINGMAFFPTLGLGQAAGILVAQAIGADRDRDIAPITWQALAIAESWMLGFALLFLFVPRPLLALFHVVNPTTVEHGVLILRFVSFYCIFDAANVIIASILAALGDTRWTLGVFLVATSSFLASLVAADALSPTISTEWGLATLFVVSTAIAWLLRLRRMRGFASLRG
jgi:MATE family multidrug resistance protein